jgi:hypothetical protein
MTDPCERSEFDGAGQPRRLDPEPLGAGSVVLPVVIEELWR